MPDVKKDANLQHIYDFLYNKGSYGRTPSIDDMIKKGWLPLVTSGLVFWDTTNKDLRYIPFDNIGRRKVAVDEMFYARIKFGPHVMPAPTVDAYEPTYLQERIGTAGRIFASNAGGTLDADVVLINALTNYYAIVKFGKIKASAAVPAGATFVVHDTAGNLVATYVLPELFAGVANAALEGIYCFIPALTVSRGLVFDTTSSALGNTRNYELQYTYFYGI